MHREIAQPSELLEQPSNTKLYLLTGFLGILILLDVTSPLFTWLNSLGLSLPLFSREFYGYRYSLIAAMIGGGNVLYSSLEKLLNGKFGAELAIAIACVAAILIREPLVAAEVVFIGSLGECLEAFTFARTQRNVRRLLEIFPIRCWLLKEGVETRVLTSSVTVGELIVVKPGGKIPIDGVIRDGISNVDMSPLTGESIPVEKKIGDEVLAGTINISGQLTIQTQRVAEKTTAGRVIEWTNKAMKDKGEIDRLVDRLAQYFLPIVLGLALLTLIINVMIFQGAFRTVGPRLSFGPALRMSLYPTLAVLVVACPCALVLATPAAMVAALGRLSGTGVLIKGISVFEGLAAVNAFAFDKTGTLTTGKLGIGKVDLFSDYDETEFLKLVGSVEQASEHPVGQCLVYYSRKQGWNLSSVSEFRSFAGSGVSGRVDGKSILIGNLGFLESQMIAIPELALAKLSELDQLGQTAILVAEEKKLIGIIGVHDQIRPEAQDILQELRNLGIEKIVILSGDRQLITSAIAEDLKVTEAIGELFPIQKAEYLQRLSQEKTSADIPLSFVFVGDGINDAPALTQASVGIAISGTHDLATEAGEIVLYANPLSPLPTLIRLSRETVRIIRQNIILFAFVLNGVGILLTSWLWPLFSSSPEWFEQAPLAGAIFHQCGSLAVLLNSMKLLWFEKPHSFSRVRRWQSSWQTLELWAERNLQIDEVLHQLAHNWKTIGGVLLASLIILIGLSGLTQIEADEIGIVKQFGKVTTQLKPGLHWRWPSFIEQVIKIKPDRIQSVENGFRSLPEEPKTSLRGSSLRSELTWNSAHGEDIQRQSDESIMITGDGNLVEILVTLRYTINDPNQYLFVVRDVDSILRMSTESILRELVASKGFLELLTTDRLKLEVKFTELLLDRTNKLIPGGLGIQLEGVSLHDLHPPQEVVKAYHEVARAIQMRDQQINQAEAEAIRKIRLAEQSKTQMIALAEASAFEKIELAKANRDRFLAWYQLRYKLTPAEEKQLDEAMKREIQSGVDAVTAQKHQGEAREKILAQRRTLSEFRLSLEMITQVLTGRDKIIIDAMNLPGKRHLFLLDPEILKPTIFPSTERPQP